MDLLNKLRNRVNDSDFVLTMYSNHNSKNLWNCICSAMDWIQVGVASVKKEHIFTNDRFLDCMNFYKYISAIDVACAGIYQLHRVFMENNTQPFANDCSIFNHHILGTKSDDEFFKELRACFGAHPVNLNNRNNREEKRFASWSIIGDSSFNEYDCNVILYSSNPEAKDIYLGVNVSELKLYFEKRYNYIEKIINKVDDLESTFITNMRKRKIKIVDNPLEQLYIIQDEIKERIYFDYIEDIVQLMILYYKTKFCSEKNHNKIANFTKKIKSGISEILRVLQDMNCTSDLEIKNVFFPKHLKNMHQWNNHFINFSCSILDQSRGIYSPLFLIEPLKDYIDFTYETFEELYFLILIALSTKKQSG